MKYKVNHTNIDREDIKNSVEAMLQFIDDNKRYDFELKVISKDHKEE